MTRVIIADDHPLMLSGIEAALRQTDYEVVAKLRDGGSVLDAIETHQPDMLILDISMPGCSGLDLLRKLKDRGDPRPVVLLTASISDGQLLEAFDLGVDGILHKEVAEALLITCLDEVKGGRRWIERGLLQRALELARGDRGQGDPLSNLTERERTIARFAAQGLRNKEIARELGITVGTVKVNLHRIYEKLEVTNRTELAVLVSSQFGNS